MAYLGNAPARSFISFERQVFTIVNSQTAYTLDHSVNNENDLRLVINNIVQEPGSGKAYTASAAIAAVFTDPAPGAFVAVALPKHTQYISSVPLTNAADSVRVVPDAVYALPEPGS